MNINNVKNVKKMKADFSDFSKGKDLENCCFYLMKTVNGYYRLFSILDESKCDASKDFIYTYYQLKSLGKFSVKNKKTSKISKYNTLKGFLKRLK